MFLKRQQATERLFTVLSQQFAVKKEDITKDMRFREELYADSLDIMELCEVLEKEFDIPKLSYEKIADIHTVEDLIYLVAPYSDEN